MHILNITLQSVAALLAIGMLGFWIIKRHIIPENILQFLAVLAIEIALPCIVFANIINYAIFPIILYQLVAISYLVVGVFGYCPDIEPGHDVCFA